MLSQINIREYLYLKNLSLELSKGLNIFTGETGVGKSLIIDAIDFVLGKKGSYKEGSYVELVFENIENEYSEEGTLILSRQIKNGKSVYFVNGRRATLSTVKEASSGIIEIHAQHHQQNLLKRDYHRILLDRYARLENLLSEYQNLFSQYKQLENQEKELSKKQGERIKELDILKYQLNELIEADIKEGEKEELEKRYRYLSEIQNIKEIVYLAENLISEDENSVLDKLDFLLKHLEKVKNSSPVLEDIYNTINDAKILIQEASFNISNLDLDYDYQELKEIEERLNLINKLEMKYSTDEKGLINLIHQFEEKINQLENQENLLPEVKRKKEEIFKQVLKLADEISYIRKEKAKEFDRLVKNHLLELGFKEAEFFTLFEEKDIDRYGKDKITFLFSANKGFSPEPIDKVASGGEISRISLALKLITGSDVECMIFDEIDTGVGGKTAVYMAEKIKKLSKNYQILLITHLPQIAAFGDKHFYVEKIYEGNSTTAVIREIKGEERKKEIARMLTGSTDEESLNLAQSLLNLSF